MFTLCFAGETEESRKRRMPGAPNIYEIFIPSPQGMMREDAFTWHLTTRNFFAFLYGKPLVAVHLGRALVDLNRRLDMFRSEEVDNRRDFAQYLEKAGYLSFGHRPDYALAILYYAEVFQIRELWVDAFAHCVGMSSLISYSPEYQVGLPLAASSYIMLIKLQGIRRSTKALINRAAADMDMQLARGVRSMSNFLEEELSNSHLGLSGAARQHLDRFRSFMHQYYVEKFGYWPPHKDAKFQKVVYKSMYFDVRGLHDFLVDNTSSDSLHSQGLVSGGICVLQNVQAFDRRHQYQALPHPLPLLPDTSALRKEQARQRRKSFLSIALASKASRAAEQHSLRAALHAATNMEDLNIVDAPLVKAYRQFERDNASAHKDEKVSPQDARKVRWILIYCVLQTLISITRAPEEVRDAERAEYPLCCTGSCVPPWEDDMEAVTSPISPESMMRFPEFPRPSTSGSQSLDLNGMPTAGKPMVRSASFEIHPDCESDVNYFGKSRSNSTQSLVSLSSASETTLTGVTATQPPPVLRRNSSIASQASQKSKKTLTFSNFGSRRSSVVAARPPTAYCEIIVHGYGNGLNETIVGSASATPKPKLDASKARPVLSTLATEDGDDGLIMKARSRPRPVSAYIPSNNNSLSAILAPQPVRPLSAHERKSIKLPADFTVLNSYAVANRTRTPVLEITEVDKFKDMMPKDAAQASGTQAQSAVSSVRTTPVSASDGTESDHNVSPVWSSRRGSASSQSSADISTAEPEKVTVVEDTAGFIDSTPVVEFQDVGGLLRESTDVTRRGIAVQRSFSVDRFRPAVPVTTSTAQQGNAIQRVRDQAFSAASRTWKRKSMRYKEDLVIPLNSEHAPPRTLRD